MVTKRVNKSGSISFLARAKSPTGTLYYKTFKTMKEAHAWLEKEKAKKRRGEYVDTSGNITIKKYFAYYIKSISPRLQERSIIAYKGDVRNHIVPLLGKKKLRDIVYNDGLNLQSFMLEKGLSNKTVNKVVALLKQGLEAASSSRGKRRELERNPLKGLQELPIQQRQITYWEAEQARNFLANVVNDHNRDIFALAINGGFRLGEIAALQCKKVDFTNNVVTISNSLVRKTGGGFRLGPTKNKLTRHFPMNQVVREILEKACKGKKANDFLFLNEKGGHVDVNHFCERRFRPTQERAGTEKNIRFHDLRHSYASIFVMNGGEMPALQKMMGHKDRNSTDIYAHLSPRYLQGAASMVEIGFPN